MDAADAFFQRAVQGWPRDQDIQFAYACFLQNQVKDLTAAEIMYSKVLQARARQHQQQHPLSHACIPASRILCMCTRIQPIRVMRVIVTITHVRVQARVARAYSRKKSR